MFFQFLQFTNKLIWNMASFDTIKNECLGRFLSFAISNADVTCDIKVASFIVCAVMECWLVKARKHVVSWIEF